MSDILEKKCRLNEIQTETLSPPQLLNIIEKEQVGQETNTGSWNFITGKRTARSPHDRYICQDDLTAKTVDWGPVNQPIAPAVFHKLWNKAIDYLSDKKTAYQANLQVGASAKYGVPVKVIAEQAWHCLFAHYLFIDPEPSQEATSDFQWTILGTPGLTTNPDTDQVNSDATVIINFTERKVLLIGMRYAGEIKKSMFSVLNFLLPEQDVLTMHCSANQGESGDTALFFGLSGTGKTTLSADPDRRLIGDDEHGWDKDGVFNLEGGCYAKTINLSRKNEPLIWDAIREGTILENVTVDDNSGIPDYTDTSRTQNARAAYPREFIDNRVHDNTGTPPSNVIFLTCDLYGVLPPVSILSQEQATYYFLSGYTALVGGTEISQKTAVKSTFSTCFGAPFFPRSATVYASLLQKRLQETGAKVYLVNTGWTGGGYNVGQRFSIPTTRRIISAILNGELQNTPTKSLPIFGLSVPTHIDGVDNSLLQPRQTWADGAAYDKQLEQLAREFIDNFKKYTDAQMIAAAGPHFEE